MWRESDEGVEHLSLLSKPAIISCESRLNVPRFVNIMGLKKAKSKKIEQVKLADLPIKQETGFKIQSIREQEKKRSAKKIDLDGIVKILNNQIHP